MSENPSQDKIQEIIELLNKEELSKAISKSNELLINFPKSILLWNIIGVANAKFQNFEEAVKCFKKIIEINPVSAEAYYNLGKAQKKIGKTQEAISSYKKTIKLNPNYAEAYNNLGNAQKDLDKLNDAILSYNNSIKIKPSLVEAHYNLGNTLKDLGKLENAIKSYKNAIKLKPNYAECYNELGGAQIDLGNLSEGILNYKRAIEINSDYAECYNNYVNSIKIKFDDPIFLKLEKIINKKNISLKENIHFSFAMGKAQLDMGNFEKGLKYINKGNKLRKEELDYNTNKTEILFDKIKKLFKNIKIKKEKNYSSTLNRPIFIVGMPRSGTTLIEQILSSHSNIYGCGELDFLYNSINLIDWQKDGLNEINISKIRKNYFYELNKICKSKFITDKMPLNFQWIGFIICAFPNSKIINVKRDPIATCWSNYKTNFSKKGMAFTFNQTDVAKFYNLYENLMNFWAKKFPNKIYNLNYEKLTENQEEETKKLFKYLDINWEKSVLNFHENKRIIQTASNIQARQKIYKGSSQEWKKYKKWLEPMIKSLK